MMARISNIGLISKYNGNFQKAFGNDGVLCSRSAFRHLIHPAL